MKKILFVLLIPTLVLGQNISINPKDFNSGNIELTRSVKENRNIKGNPYLDKTYSASTILFKDGTEYKGFMRFNASKNVFELKSESSDEIYEFILKQGISILHLDKKFEAMMLNAENKVTTFEVLVEANPYALYKYHKKVIQEPRKDAIAMPSSNQGDNKDAYWSDQSFLILMYNNDIYQIEKSHKKLIKSGLVEVGVYNKIIKERKYKLDTTEDVIELIRKLNNN
jgi:hypothetical protein